MPPYTGEACKIGGCGNPPRNRSGIYAGLCSVHTFEQRRLREKAEEPLDAALESRLRAAAGEDEKVREHPPAPPPGNGGLKITDAPGLEKRVKELLPAARAVDRARTRRVRSVEQAKAAVDEHAQAKEAFRKALEALLA